LTKHLKFEIDDIKILERKGGDQALFGEGTEDSQFAVAKVRAFSSGWNRHDMYCSEEVLEKTSKTIFYKPLLYVLNKGMDDFGSHAAPEQSRPAGFVFPEGMEFVRLGDGRLSLNVIVKIWKRYAPTVMSIFERDKGKKAVSVEMELFDFASRKDGSLDMLDFSYMAITILGDIIQEGSPGANIEILSFSDEVEKFKQDFVSELSLTYNQIDFTIPNEVKARCQEGISLFGTYGGASPQNLRSAGYIVGHDVIEPDLVKVVYSIHNSNSLKKIDKTIPSGDFVDYLLLGGKEGVSWIENLYLLMKKAEEDKISKFEKITFPYSKLKKASAETVLDKKMEKNMKDKNIEKNEMDSEYKDPLEDNEKDFSNEEFVENHNDSEEVQEDSTDNSTDFYAEDSKDKEDMEDEESDQEDMEGEKSDQEDMEDMEDEEDSDESDEDVFEGKTIEADPESIFAILSDVEEVQDLLSEEVLDIAKVFEALIALNAVLVAQNATLESFKEKIDKDNFDRQVDITLNKISGKFEIPEDVISEMKNEASEFSLENLDQWKNKCKAEALDKFPLKKSDDGDDEDVPVFGLNWPTEKDVPHSSKWQKYLNTLEK